MKFIACSKTPNKDWGRNSLVNLDLCVTFSPGMISPGMTCNRGKPEAPAIHFIAVGQDRNIIWAFENEAARDDELARINAMAIGASDAAILRSRVT